MPQSKPDPMKGVAEPETVIHHIRAAMAGNWDSQSFVRGVRTFYVKKAPNPYLVPLLTKVLEKSRGI